MSIFYNQIADNSGLNPIPIQAFQSALCTLIAIYAPTLHLPLFSFCRSRLHFSLLYIARSLLLASGYLAEAGEGDLSALRAEQARALAEAYDLDLPDTPEELATLLDEADAALAKDAESTMDVLGYGTEPVIPSAVIEAPLDSDR